MNEMTEIEYHEKDAALPSKTQRYRFREIASREYQRPLNPKPPAFSLAKYSPGFCFREEVTLQTFSTIHNQCQLCRALSAATTAAVQPDKGGNAMLQ